MVWVPPMTAIAGEPLTAAQFNTHIRDNLNETATSKAYEDALTFTTTTENEIRASKIDQQHVTNLSWTQSQEYTDLNETGPTIYFTTGGAAIIWLDTAFMNHGSSIGEKSFMSFELGPVDFVGQQEVSSVLRAPNDEHALWFTKGTASLYPDEVMKFAGTFWVADLEPERLYRARAKYRCTGGVGIFQFRKIGVIPL